MRRLLLIISFIGLFTEAFAALRGDGDTNYRVEGVQTQGLYYRDASFDQPIIGAKFLLTGEHRFWRIGFRFSNKTNLKSLRKLKLYKTSVNYFSPARATELKGAKATVVEGREIHFDFWNNGKGPEIIIRPNEHLWLTAQVQPSMPRGSTIDAAITHAHVNGIVCMVENEAPIGEGVVYEFDRHVVPYYRMGFIQNWNKNYYNYVSEVVFFYMRVNNDGTLGHGWDCGKQYDETSFQEALNQLKQGRGSLPVRILLGIAHCAGELSRVTQNPALREKLAQHILDAVKKYDLDGVDIDWEYPGSAADWRGFEALVADLKPKLFALGGGKMISSAMSNYKFPEAVNHYGLGLDELKGLHQQLDMLNTMTYDAASTDGHSPFWLHHQSKDFATRYAGLPPCKINIGMPCYTNEHHLDGRLTWKQNGYSWLVGSHLKDLQNKDVFKENGMLYSYNSIKTIRAKAKDLKKGGYGVMIWGYDTDAPLNNIHAFARTLAGVFRPSDRPLPVQDKAHSSTTQKKATPTKAKPSPPSRRTSANKNP